MKHCLAALVMLVLLAGGAYAAHGYATVLSSFSVDEWTTIPEDITYDGANLWITDAYEGKMIKLTTTGSFLSSVSLSPIFGPTGISWDGTSFWITGSASGPVSTFYHVNTSGSIISSFPGALSYNYPFGEQYLSGNCWVTSTYTDRKIYQHSMTNGSIISTIQTIAKYPCGICYDGTNLLVSGSDDGWTHRYSTNGSYLDYFLPPFQSNGYEGGTVWVNNSMYWVNANAHMVYQLSVDWNPPTVEPSSLGLVRSLYK